MAILTILKTVASKISLKLVGVTAIVLVAVYGGYAIKSHFASADMVLYKRQLSGQLDAKEKALEAANAQLGTLNSKLVSQSTLNDQLSNDNAAMKKFIKDNNLVAKSVDSTTDKLTGVTTGGTSVTDTSNGVVSYSWKDIYNRFQLRVPNINIQGGEIFTNNQMFIINGEVFAQKNGFLETRKVEMKEVYQDKDGKYQSVPNSNVIVVDSKFDYVNAPVDANTGLLKLRFYGAAAYPFGAKLGGMLGLEFLEWHNFGLSTATLYDGTLKDTEQFLNINWIPSILSTSLNISPFVGVGTHYDNVKDINVGIGLLFFLNQ